MCDWPPKLKEKCKSDGPFPPSALETLFCFFASVSFCCLQRALHGEGEETEEGGRRARSGSFGTLGAFADASAIAQRLSAAAAAQGLTVTSILPRPSSARASDFLSGVTMQKIEKSIIRIYELHNQACCDRQADKTKLSSRLLEIPSICLIYDQKELADMALAPLWLWRKRGRLIN